MVNMLMISSVLLMVSWVFEKGRDPDQIQAQWDSPRFRPGCDAKINRVCHEIATLIGINVTDGRIDGVTSFAVRRKWSPREPGFNIHY